MIARPTSIRKTVRPKTTKKMLTQQRQNLNRATTWANVFNVYHLCFVVANVKKIMILST